MMHHGDKVVSALRQRCAVTDSRQSSARRATRTNADLNRANSAFWDHRARGSDSATVEPAAEMRQEPEPDQFVGAVCAECGSTRIIRDDRTNDPDSERREEIIRETQTQDRQRFTAADLNRSNAAFWRARR